MCIALILIRQPGVRADSKDYITGWSYTIGVDLKADLSVCLNEVEQLTVTTSVQL